MCKARLCTFWYNESVKTKIHAVGEYFHIYNRGVRKQPIFEIDADRFRFLFLLLVFQADIPIKNMSREIKQSVQSLALHIENKLAEQVIKGRTVELVHFCLMPNHFHLILKECEEGAIVRYMHRVLTAYSKYFNIRHEKSGHLFEGSYRSKLIEDDRQLMHLSVYIHKNPRELREWAEKEHLYPWSSYQDCLFENRFGKLLVTNVVTDRYRSSEDSYRKFLDSSTAKDPFE